MAGQCLMSLHYRIVDTSYTGLALLNYSPFVQHIKLTFPVKSPTSNLQCFLSSLFIILHIISIRRSFQTYLAGPIFFTGFPLHPFQCLCAFFYLGLISAHRQNHVEFHSCCLGPYPHSGQPICSHILHHTAMSRCPYYEYSIFLRQCCQLLDAVVLRNDFVTLAKGATIAA